MYGKMIYKGTNLPACCTRPSLAEGHIISRFFPVVVCKNCGEVTGVIGGLCAWIFDFFFSPFWDGRVYVKADQVNDGDVERIKEFIWR